MNLFDQLIHVIFFIILILFASLRNFYLTWTTFFIFIFYISKFLSIFVLKFYEEFSDPAKEKVRIFIKVYSRKDINLIEVLYLKYFFLFFLKFFTKILQYNIFKKIEVGFKLLIFMQILMISLKIDDLVSWKWNQVFWVYWIFFTLMFGISLGFLVIIINKFYQICINNYKIRRS